MLKVNVVLNTGKQTIRESSHCLYRLLKGLSKVNSFFHCPLLRHEGFEDVLIDFNLDQEEITSSIEKTILEFLKSDILRNDGEPNPDFDYSRDFGFSVLVQYKNQNQEISFTGKLGSSSVNALGQLSNNGFAVDIQIGNEIFRGLIDTGLVKHGVIKLSDVKFLKACRPYKYPLGVITYFSNESEWQIPNDLEGIKYEHTDNGKYLILPREDFATDPEKYEVDKQKLLELMEEIKRRVPEYGK
jgi:hypothetical protein